MNILKTLLITLMAVNLMGCVATYNGKNMNVEKDYISPEKKYFERTSI